MSRDFHTVPVGGKPVLLRMAVQRLECKDCGHVCQEHVHFAAPQMTFARRLAKYAVELCRMAPIKSVAAHLNLSWNTVKEMVKGYLERNYSKPDISGLRVIGIDEFAVKKGHVYKTIVVNLENGQIVYVEVRRRIVNQERAREKKDGMSGRSSVVKGTKYILLRNSEDLTDQKDIDRLGAALELNRDLSAAYYLKEDARLIWDCDSKHHASLQLDAWLASARTSLVPELVKVADSVESHRDGILAYFDKPISTGPVEGINNKIKTLKRMAYGFRDDRYFTLRLLALHDFKFS